MMICRPRKRSQCVNGVRPCPWVSCRYHMIWMANRVDYLSDEQVMDKILNMPETCVLDVADKSGLTLRELAAILGVSRSRVCQLIKGDKRTMGIIEKMRHINRRGFLEPFAS